MFLVFIFLSVVILLKFDDQFFTLKKWNDTTNVWTVLFCRVIREFENVFFVYYGFLTFGHFF